MPWLHKTVQAFQLIYSSWGSIKSKYKDIEDIINVINLKVPDYKSLSISKDFEFNKEIEIKNLDFRYSENDN